MKIKASSQVVFVIAGGVVGSSSGRQLRAAPAFTPKSEALALTMAECGSNFGDGSALDLQVGDGSGSCPDNGQCANFYTLGNLLSAIDDFNGGLPLEQQFPSPVRGSRCLTLAAFLGQTYFESAQYRACKEHTSPCPAWSASSCSGGRASDYVPANQGTWVPATIPGTNRTGPAKGCTDYWGEAQSVTDNCWFGRGAIQLTWLPNYAKFMPAYLDDPDMICEDGQAGWQGSVAYWQANKAKFTGSCESATSVPSPAQCDPACKQARCDEQAKITAVLQPQTAPPTQAPTAPPPAGLHTVTADEANGGCWAIGDAVCPGQGNQWSANICSPAHAVGVCPPIKAGDVVRYSCSGC